MKNARFLWLPIIIAALALGWRMMKLHFGWNDTLANFSPWVALAFAGSLIMPKQMPWWLWPALLLGCDFLSHPQDIGVMWAVYVCLGLSAIAGSVLRQQTSIATLVIGTVICSVGFYLVTSTQAWWLNPIYSKTAAGWWQAVTIGDPAWQPQSWVFLVRQLLSDAGFSLLLLCAYNGEAKARQAQPMPLVAKAA